MLETIEPMTDTRNHEIKGTQKIIVYNKHNKHNIYIIKHIIYIYIYIYISASKTKRHQ